MLLRARQRRIVDHFRHNASKFINFVCDLVHVNAIVFGDLLEVAVTARIQQELVVLVLARIEHVIAFLTEFDTNEAGTIATGVLDNRILSRHV